MRRGQRSLKRHLIVQPLILQFLTLAVASVVFVMLIINSTVDGMYADDRLIGVAAKAVVRKPDGTATINMTPDLMRMRKTAPDTWFIATLKTGEIVSFGSVPRVFAALAPHLAEFTSADFRGRSAPYTLSAIIREEAGSAGEMTIAGHGSVQPFSLLMTLVSNLVAIPVFLALAIVAFVATPLIVRRALAGVLRIAEEAEGIDADRRGLRLSEDAVPREIAPLVRAVNDALGRLDEGYERQRRFIASAAHELRTPIAILRMKIDASRDASVRAFSGDVSRLTNLSEQLLDLHRLENGAPHECIHLAALARRVAADLAPLLIAANKSIEVVIEKAGDISGNAGAIERVLTNLIQNAVEHGGPTVIVRVDGSSIEVEDDGDGIPWNEREKVFEPFHRLRPRSSGTGLGLNLVRQVMDHHHGRVTLLDATGGGTVVRAEFPPLG